MTTETAPVTARRSGWSIAALTVGGAELIALAVAGYARLTAAPWLPQALIVNGVLFVATLVCAWPAMAATSENREND